MTSPALLGCRQLEHGHFASAMSLPLPFCPSCCVPVAGDVPNLFGPEDMEAISAGVRPAMAAAGLPINKMTIYSYFVNRYAVAGGHACCDCTTG
jgi:hypothetical protein